VMLVMSGGSTISGLARASERECSIRWASSGRPMWPEMLSRSPTQGKPSVRKGTSTLPSCVMHTVARERGDLRRTSGFTVMDAPAAPAGLGEAPGA